MTHFILWVERLYVIIDFFSSYILCLKKTWVIKFERTKYRLTYTSLIILDWVGVNNDHNSYGIEKDVRYKYYIY